MRDREDGGIRAPPFFAVGTNATNHSRADELRGLEPGPSQTAQISQRAKGKRKAGAQASASPPATATVSKHSKQSKQQHLLKHSNEHKRDPANNRADLSHSGTIVSGAVPSMRSGARLLSSGAAVNTAAWDVTAAAAALVCLHSRTKGQASGQSATSTAVLRVKGSQSRLLPGPALMSSSRRTGTADSSANASLKPILKRNPDPSGPSSSSSSALKAQRTAQTSALKLVKGKAASSKKTGPEQIRCKCGKRISVDHPPCKSGLVLLCEQFTQRFGQLTADGSPRSLPLNEVAAALSVPRRRLYDILNVLEAVEVVVRVCKLTYHWCGTAHISHLASQLAADELQGRPLEDRERKAAAPGPAGKPGGGGAGHSLWHLSRKLVRLLVTHEGAMSLSEAATRLVDGPEESRCTARTIERRLYDVGSILTTVGFIEKIYLPSRQPAFRWATQIHSHESD